MANSISLTASMRSNLLSLKNIASQMNKTQNILSTGKKVNSAIDNPSSYYQARALANRSEDLDALLDSMGQGIQTIQAATEALESATTYLEQATAVANQAMAQNISKSYADYLDEGYKEITSAMATDEIQALLVDDAKLILRDDISLSDGLVITAKNVIINGNGKTVSLHGDDKSAITVKNKGASAEITNIKINVSGVNAVGVKATESGSVVMDNSDGINVSGEGAQKIYYREEVLFNGKEYTQAIYNQLKDANSADGTAVETALQYSASGIDANDETFGVGKWYIGAIGEWTDLYGYDYADVTTSGGDDGANRKTLSVINQTFGKMGADATSLDGGRYWSSSEGARNTAWVIIADSGDINHYNKDLSYKVRCFNMVENCYNPENENAPNVGDIMYDDKTWSSADDYAKNVAAGKKAVGVVFDVDTANADVKIVALKDASSGVAMDPTYLDIDDVPNHSSFTGGYSLKNTGEFNFTHEQSAGSAGNSGYSDQFSTILREYDKLISDASYQGVNLLKGANLTVTFNESRTNKFMVEGQDMSSDEIGLNTKKWSSKLDVEKSISELIGAVSSIRDFQTELGNNYSIIQTRQDFTEALCDVLETGADNLVLADMNEESANYLALQTRQQLAVNSLSLAAQSAQSVLSLF